MQPDPGQLRAGYTLEVTADGRRQRGSRRREPGDTWIAPETCHLRRIDSGGPRNPASEGRSLPLMAVIARLLRR